MKRVVAITQDMNDSQKYLAAWEIGDSVVQTIINTQLEFATLLKELARKTRHLPNYERDDIDETLEKIVNNHSKINTLCRDAMLQLTHLRNPEAAKQLKTLARAMEVTRKIEERY